MFFNIAVFFLLREMYFRFYKGTDLDSNIEYRPITTGYKENNK